MPAGPVLARLDSAPFGQALGPSAKAPDRKYEQSGPLEGLVAAVVSALCRETERRHRSGSG